MSSGHSICECRLCRGKSLINVFSFGDVPLGNNLATDQSEAFDADVYPLELFRCNSCMHFQLGYSVDPNILFARNYTYLSGIGSAFLRHMDEFVDYCLRTISLKNPKLFEIGCNDGTLLSKFAEHGITVKGVDPANMPSKLGRDVFGLDIDTSFFDEKYVSETVGLEKYDLVVSQNVFAHVADLRMTLGLIKQMLNDDGYVIFEIGYFIKVVENSLFDTIYHEHLDYHTAGPLARLLNELGFSVVDVQTNESQGGSLRVAARRGKEVDNCEALARMIAEEQVLTAELVREKAGLWREDALALGDRLRAVKSIGNQIVGYGSPTKCVLLIAMSDIGEFIDLIIEDNTKKQGLFLPRTGIPLVDFSELGTDTTVVVFAWNFFDDILLKLRSRGFRGQVIKGCLPFEESSFA